MTRGSDSSGVRASLRRIPVGQAVIGVVLLLVTIGIFVAGVRSNGQQTPLETFYFQLFLAGFGVAGGWVLSSATGRTTERQRMEDRAQSAVRRSWQLYKTLGKINLQTQRHIDAIDASGAEKISAESVKAMLIGVQAIAEATTATADDAMSDWRDVAPNVVDGEIEKLQDREGNRGPTT